MAGVGTIERLRASESSAAASVHRSKLTAASMAVVTATASLSGRTVLVRQGGRLTMFT